MTLETRPRDGDRGARNEAADGAEPGAPEESSIIGDWQVAFGYRADRLSMVPMEAAIVGWLGLLLAVFDWRLRLGLVPLLIAAPLLAAPLSALIFTQWFDGSTIVSRRWGIADRMQLAQVVLVEADAKSPGAIVLRGQGKAVRVVLRSRFHVVPSPARERLLVGLRHPDVLITGEAERRLRAIVSASSRRRGRLRAAIGLFGCIATLALIAARPALAARQRAVPGAPGYTLVTDDSGRVITVGSPWGGTSCTSIELAPGNALSSDLYSQLRAVVNEATRHRIPISLSGRGLAFAPSAPPSGWTGAVAPTNMVGIFVSDAPPPVSNGRTAVVRIEPYLESVDGIESLYYVKATFYRAGLARGLPLRTAIRRVIASAEGLGDATARASGLRSGTRIDAFTKVDLRALTITSGCPTSS